jgi:hypothetical protein
MTKVYRIVNGGAELMDPVRCKDEGRELQDLLEKSPELLAGDQIDPEVPRRWLLIKREMSVPDPVSAVSRWSIDFLYVDQDATLTFVECKRQMTRDHGGKLSHRFSTTWPTRRACGRRRSCATPPGKLTSTVMAHSIVPSPKWAEPPVPSTNSSSEPLRTFVRAS